MSEAARALEVRTLTSGVDEWHRDGRGHELLEITPIGEPEEIVVFELHASRVA